jgi:hypothetical protein
LFEVKGITKDHVCAVIVSELYIALEGEVEVWLLDSDSQTNREARAKEVVKALVLFDLIE